MEVFGSGSGRNKYVSQAMLEKLKKGGTLADEIAEQSKAHHTQHDVPQAEKLLQEQIQKLETEKQKKHAVVHKEPLSLWERAKVFIQSIFYPVS